MIQTFTHIISVITIFLLLLYSVFLITSGKKRTGRFFLAGFLFANGAYILNFLLNYYRLELQPFAVNFLFIGKSFGFLFGPLIYLYSKSETDRNFRFSAIHMFHFFPFIFITEVILYRFQFRSYEHKTEIIRNGLFNSIEANTIIILLNALTFAYLVLSFLVVKRKNKEIKSYYSYTEKVNFYWLNLIIAAFFFMWTADLLNWILSSLKMNTPASEIFITFISILINFVFASLLIFKNLRSEQPENIAVNGNNDRAEKTKYESSTLTSDRKTEILDILENVMANEKLYLDPSLNLGQVARKISVTQRHLSQVLNETKNQNFYDFVNSYRIGEVKKLLREPEYENEKILSILYDCGFNSKSAFNTTFKKITGMTPTEYRKTHNRLAETTVDTK